MGRLGDAREAHLLQLLVDPDSGLVGPADHGKPAQDARECDERRHRSVLVHNAQPARAFVRGPGRAVIGTASSLLGAKRPGRKPSRIRTSPNTPASPPGPAARPAGWSLIQWA